MESKAAYAAKCNVVDRYGPDNGPLVGLFVDAYLSLLSSSPFDVQKPARLISRFRDELLTDVRGVIRRMSSLADDIMRTPVRTSEYTKTGDFLDDMKRTPVFREYLTFFRTGDPKVYKFLLSFLMFGKKLDLDYPDLAPAAFRDWLMIEEDLEKLTFDSAETDVLKDVISVLIDVEKFDDSIFLPKNGSGAVAERIDTKAEKFEHLAFDAKLATTFRVGRLGRFSSSFKSPGPHNDPISHNRGKGLSKSVPAFLGQRADLESLRNETVRRMSRSALVSKSEKSYRYIGMEPASYMYAQQDVMRWLVNTMQASPINAFCDIRDQSLNQKFALDGSAHGCLDTIDLSAASDRVHTDLVKAVFPKRILRYLLGTRSSLVILPDGSHKRMVKFAPMGSALCFPTQCIIFSGITVIGYLMQHYSCTLEELSKIDSKELVQTTRSLLRSLNHNSAWLERGRLFAFRVYGDDIICDTKVTENVLYLLEHFGFKVNVSKSFTAGQSVRESCGIFAYEGEDVTPLLFRVKRWSSEDKLNPKAFVSWVAAINRAGDFGFRQLHSYLIRSLKSRLLNDFGAAALRFTEDREEFGVWTKQLHASANRLRRYDPEAPIEPIEAKISRAQAWQVDFEKVLLVRDCDFTSTKKWQSYHYDQWMRSKLKGGSNDDFVASSSFKLPRHARIVWGWIPRRA